jgi:hypothetical protein
LVVREVPDMMETEVEVVGHGYRLQVVEKAEERRESEVESGMEIRD